ncbi:MAG: serine phosphatase RsbU (regulator of sigma subunit) [Crocinitomicaceae bacterium]|jgi:serine phosphatase RsbU (regulator of sigma subunit)
MNSIIRIFLALFFSLLAGSHLHAQDILLIDEETNFLGKSITDRFTIFHSDVDMKIDDFLGAKEEMEGAQMTHRLENLDFTTGTFFIHFTIVNSSSSAYSLVLETARPVTNVVELFSVNEYKTVFSGDGIPFSDKTIPSSASVLPLNVPSGRKCEYVLKLSSDGENLTLPMVFMEKKSFEESAHQKHLFSGMFYGIFLFVLIIYLTFFTLLRENLFLTYVAYVLFGGLLQFGLDGYIHQYIFTSGGFWSQHSILIVAGFTVLFMLLYASKYLVLTGKLKLISTLLLLIVSTAMILSLFSGKLYEIAYPLINGFSFLALLFVLVAGIIQRRSGKVSRLFIVGLGCLVVGGLIFILGNFGVIDAPSITQQSLKIGTLLEVICLSILMAGRYKSLQEEKELAQQQLLNEFEVANVRLEKEVAERTKEIEKQRAQLKEKNEDFVASVKYAERIQSAVMSNEDKFKSYLPDSVVFFRPKDIVSGDFYWIDMIEPSEEWPDGLVVYATADCTGHGVPGALVSIIGNHLLKLGRKDETVQSPGQALDFLSREINATLNSKFAQENIRDGMDITLCALDLHKKEIHFAGAQNSAYVIRDGELIELKGDRKSVGYDDREEEHHFSTLSYMLKPGDMIYTCSDGYADQFGGPDGKKFMSKRLKNMFINMAASDLEDQKQLMVSEFDGWKGEQEQLDDVLVIGVRIT